MAQALVQNPGEQNLVASGPFTSYQYTWPSQPTVGNKLILPTVVNAFPTSASTTITATDNATTPNTYTARDHAYVGYESTTNLECDVAHLPASGNLKTTFTFSQAVYLIFAPTEWSGLTVAGYDTGANAGSTTNTGTTFAIGPTATLATTAELLLSIYGGNTASMTAGISVPSGWTSIYLEQDDNDYVASGAAYLVVSATTAITATWGNTSNVNGDGNTGSVSAFKIATGGSSANISAAQTLAQVTQAAALDDQERISGAQTLLAEAQAANLIRAVSNLSAAQSPAQVTQASALDDVERITGTQTLAQVTQAGALDDQERLSGTQTLLAEAQAAAVGHGGVANLTGTQTLVQVTQASTLQDVERITGAQTPLQVTQTSTVQVPDSTHTAQVLLAEAQAGLLADQERVTGAQTLLAEVQVATIVHLGVANLSASQALVQVTQATTLQLLAKVSGSQTLLAEAQAAAAAHLGASNLSAAQALLAELQFAHAGGPYTFDDNNRTWHVAGENRVQPIGPESRSYGVAPEDRTFTVKAVP